MTDSARDDSSPAEAAPPLSPRNWWFKRHDYWYELFKGISVNLITAGILYIFGIAAGLLPPPEIAVGAPQGVFIALICFAPMEIFFLYYALHNTPHLNKWFYMYMLLSLVLSGILLYFLLTPLTEASDQWLRDRFGL